MVDVPPGRPSLPLPGPGRPGGHTEEQLAYGVDLELAHAVGAAGRARRRAGAQAERGPAAAEVSAQAGRAWPSQESARSAKGSASSAQRARGPRLRAVAAGGAARGHGTGAGRVPGGAGAPSAGRAGR